MNYDKQSGICGACQYSRDDIIKHPTGTQSDYREKHTKGLRVKDGKNFVYGDDEDVDELTKMTMAHGSTVSDGVSVMAYDKKKYEGDYWSCVNCQHVVRGPPPPYFICPKCNKDMNVKEE
jgi:rubrerythrin